MKQLLRLLSRPDFSRTVSYCSVLSGRSHTRTRGVGRVYSAAPGNIAARNKSLRWIYRVLVWSFAERDAQTIGKVAYSISASQVAGTWVRADAL